MYFITYKEHDIQYLFMKKTGYFRMCLGCLQQNHGLDSPKPHNGTEAQSAEQAVTDQLQSWYPQMELLAFTAFILTLKCILT